MAAKRVVPTRTCPECGQDVPRSRGVCPECGHITKWFKIRIVFGLACAVAGFLGIGIMTFMALLNAK